MGLKCVFTTREPPEAHLSPHRGGSELAERDLRRSLRLEDECAHGFDVL